MLATPDLERSFHRDYLSLLDIEKVAKESDVTYRMPMIFETEISDILRANKGCSVPGGDLIWHTSMSDAKPTVSAWRYLDASQYAVYTLVGAMDIVFDCCYAGDTMLKRTKALGLDEKHAVNLASSHADSASKIDIRLWESCNYCAALRGSFSSNKNFSTPTKTYSCSPGLLLPPNLVG